MNWDGAKYAFVVPRFGKEVSAGAETLVGAIARKLSERSETIDVLTTCATDNRTWENQLPSGTSKEDGVRVLRFEVRPRDLEVWVPLQIRLSEGLVLTPEEELLWMEHSVNSDELYRYIHTFGRSYKAIFFAPYLFGTTFWGSLIHPDRSVLIPCLHDESYAYTKIIRSMFQSVKGCVFNAPAEGALARDLYGDLKGSDVGMGFDPLQLTTGDNPYFSDSTPYLLYVGRKETGKNLHLLVSYFMEAKDTAQLPSDLKLVIAGGGSFSDLHLPQALSRRDVIDVGRVSEEAKHSLIKHALCVVQPSTNESFSIVIMESWQHCTPVLVHARSAVTREHVEQAQGGLYFGNQDELVAVVTRFLSDPTLRSQLGRNGEFYVKSRYNWPEVLRRFDRTVQQILSDDEVNEGQESNR